MKNLDNYLFMFLGICYMLIGLAMAIAIVIEFLNRNKK